MNQITPIFIPVNTTPTPPPKCPHCKNELEGWSEPGEDISVKKILLVATLFIYLIAQGLAFMDGSYDGQSEYKRTDPWFSKRWHWVFPGYQVGFRTSRWLTETKWYGERE